MDRPWDDVFDDLLRSRAALLAPGDPLDPDDPFILLGVDSVQLVSLIAAAEEAYGVTLSAEDLATSLATPNSVWRAFSRARLLG